MPPVKRSRSESTATIGPSASQTTTVTVSKPSRLVRQRTLRPKKSVIPRFPGVNTRGIGFPTEKIVDLTYADADQTIVTGAGSSIGLVYFGANDPFDPRYAVGGHQPRGFDQYTPVYSKYQVLASRIRVTYAFASSPAAVTVGIHTTSSTTAQTYAYDYIELGKTSHGFMPSDSSGMKTITHYVDVAKFFGLTQDAFQADDLTSSAVGSAPSTKLYYHLFAQAIAGGQGALTLPIYVEVTYRIRFFNCIDVAGS